MAERQNEATVATRRIYSTVAEKRNEVTVAKRRIYFTVARRRNEQWYGRRCVRCEYIYLKIRVNEGVACTRIVRSTERYKVWRFLVKI